MSRIVKYEVSVRLDGDGCVLGMPEIVCDKIRQAIQKEESLAALYEAIGISAFFESVKPIKEKTGEEWLSTETLPPMVDHNLHRSEEVLCQDKYRDTFIGYVSYSMNKESQHERHLNLLPPEKPSWHQQGKGMHFLDDIVIWIPLSCVLPE